MLQVTWKDRDATVWVEFEGEMDHQDVLSIREEFLARIDEAEGNVVIVLGGVTFMASMGLGMLVAARKSLLDRGHALKLSGVPDSIHKILVETNLVAAFELI